MLLFKNKICMLFLIVWITSFTIGITVPVVISKLCDIQPFLGLVSWQIWPWKFDDDYRFISHCIVTSSFRTIARVSRNAKVKKKFPPEKFRYHVNTWKFTQIFLLLLKKQHSLAKHFKSYSLGNFRCLGLSTNISGFTALCKVQNIFSSTIAYLSNYYLLLYFQTGKLAAIQEWVRIR